MRHNKLFLSILFCLISFTLAAQRTISGRVTDEESGEPVANASVFIANTTIGVTTDATGYYQLKLSREGISRFVVSHVGYESVYADIEPERVSVIFDVALKTATMEEVTVAAKARFRKYDVDLFWRTILGQKPTKNIQPLNPEAVYYYFNSATGKLTVTCREPIQIVNYETGYRIDYFLNHFTHDYINDITDWDAEHRFTELEPKTLTQKNKWDKKRKYVHSVRIANFIESLHHHTMLENGFIFIWEHKKDFRISETIFDSSLGISSRTTLFKTIEGSTQDRVNDKMFLSTDSVTGRKKFYIPPEMNVLLICYGAPDRKSTRLNSSH